MKLLRRLFNKDEKIGESILSKMDHSTNLTEGFITTSYECSGGTHYVFNIDGFTIKSKKENCFDMTSGSSWSNYYLIVDDICLSVSTKTRKDIFNKAYSILKKEEIDRQEELLKEKEFLYKDIKINFR